MTTIPSSNPVIRLSEIKRRFETGRLSPVRYGFELRYVYERCGGRLRSEIEQLLERLEDDGR